MALQARKVFKAHKVFLEQTVLLALQGLPRLFNSLVHSPLSLITFHSNSSEVTQMFQTLYYPARPFLEISI
jgi:hypothetical protein